MFSFTFSPWEQSATRKYDRLFRTEMIFLESLPWNFFYGLTTNKTRPIFRVQAPWVYFYISIFSCISKIRWFWKYCSKVLFVYLNDNQGTQDRWWLLLFTFFGGKKQLASTYSVFTLVSFILNEQMRKRLFSRTNCISVFFLIKSWDSVVVLIEVMFVVSTQYLIYTVICP